MIRNALALTLLAGCTGSQDLYMTHMSTMESETRGVVLYDDGQRGHAAMWDTTCEFDTLNGWLIEDYDLPTSDEIIQDQLNGTAVARSAQGIHMVHERVDIDMDHVIETRLLNGGDLATLRWAETEHCVVDIGADTVEVDVEICAGATSADTDRMGTLYVANGESAWQITADGAAWMAANVDLVVYDRSIDVTYVAELGGTELAGLGKGGEVLWTVQTLGPIASVDDMGQRGYAVVLVSDLTTGRGAMQMFEGRTGEEEVRHETPTGDGEITVSTDGTTLSITLPEYVHFYDVIAEGETPKKRRTLGVQAQTFSD
jgi:hypothetical protein